MSLVNYSCEELSKACFLPHHAVLRDDNLTTKLRVVFDASSKTTTGISLNDTLMVGGVVQSDLLAWIAAPPCRLKTFVSNRVVEIAESSLPSQWYHVASTDNPADILSRGMSPQNLFKNKLWWHGPEWLQQNHSQWPSQAPIKNNDPSHLPEIKLNQFTLLTSNSSPENNFLDELISKYSSISKLQRILAYAKRFINNSKVRKPNRLHQPLSVQELDESMLILIKHVQIKHFHKEIQLLQRNSPLSSESNLLSLNPFLHDGILRVGGRINYSDLPFNQKHPILLPHKDQFTNLIITYEHLRTFHGSHQLVLSAVRQKFWPIAGMAAVKQIINSCILCKRANAYIRNPLMGDLPKSRVTPSRPFWETGIDYAGPILVKELTRSSRRGPPTKAYLAIFICFATKAVHVEVVSSLATEAFINALKRFISRRGICKKLHSDNGTNFVGANNQLIEWYNLISTSLHNDLV